MLDADDLQFIREKIAVEVWGGFKDEDEVRKWVAAEPGVDDESLVDELTAYVTQQFRQHRRREARWRKSTMNDSIDRAFDEMNLHGIVALQNAGYTLSDGWSEAHQAADVLAAPARGAVFYHSQDLEAGVAGEGLMLAFGAFESDPLKRDSGSAVIGREVCDVLAANGVRAKWDGAVESRIEIPPFVWRKRR
ncbi:hypothetical protein SAZ11_03585 [Streptomyces sp. FXJ1.4098]|nr:hypothetical protein [Streptomyces sp. FXJ1.4098]